MNIIDVLAILPYYVELWMAVEKGTNEADVHSFEPADNFLSVNLTNTILAVDAGETEEDNLQGVLQVFRVFKLARILKLARHSRGLQSIIFTLSQSARELGLLVLILIITGLAFSSLAYYIELVSPARLLSDKNRQVSRERKRGDKNISGHFN